MYMNDRSSLRWGYVLAALLISNYFAWLIAGGLLGGFAFLGKIDGVHFFLGTHTRKQPTQFTEVTRAIYTYSVWHTAACLGLIPVIMVLVEWMRIVQNRMLARGERVWLRISK